MDSEWAAALKNLQVCEVQAFFECGIYVTVTPRAIAKDSVTSVRVRNIDRACECASCICSSADREKWKQFIP